MNDRWTLTLSDRLGIFDPLNVSDMDWWTPTLGPTASLLLPKMIRAALSANGQGRFDPAGFAYQLGVPAKVLDKTVRRLQRFHIVGLLDAAGQPISAIAVRRWLSEVPPYNVLTAPPWWQAAYSQAIGDRAVIGATA